MSVIDVAPRSSGVIRCRPVFVHPRSNNQEPKQKFTELRNSLWNQFQLTIEFVLVIPQTRLL